MIQKLINKYNKQGSIMVISNYPKQGSTYACQAGGGLASFTKNTTKALSGTSKKRKLIVICDQEKQQKDVYEEDGILVIRAFRRNTPELYLNILKEVKKFNKVSNILVEFEFASYGDFLVTSLFPLFLLTLRLMQRRVVLTLHQVLLDLFCLQEHIGVKKGSIKFAVFNAILPIFYFLLGKTANSLVVLEQEHKNRLEKVADLKKIQVIPHGVDKNVKSVSRALARRKLGISHNDFILLYFGFLTAYKGADFLVKTFAKKSLTVRGKRLRVILAGGESPTQKDKKHYKEFLYNIYKMARGSKTVKITGFVPQEDIPYWFAAANLIILPYRAFMSSSGPLSLALSFQKPFIISKPLKNYLLSSDFASAMTKSGLSKKDITFFLREDAMVAKIKQVAKRQTLGSLAKFSSLLAKRRNYKKLAVLYHPLFGKQKSLFVLPKVSFSPVTVNFKRVLNFLPL